MVMPKCDTCGFSHAQPHHCINCGSTDPFRRHRIIKLAAGALLAALALALAAYLYTRYTAIEKSVRQAELENGSERGFAAPRSDQR